MRFDYFFAPPWRLSDRGDHQQALLQMAFAAAEQGVLHCRPNPAVGCVMVRDHELIAVASHRLTGGDHAEKSAIKQSLGYSDGSTCYVTLQPCHHQGRSGSCVDALIAANVRRVVFAAVDPNPRANTQVGCDRLQRAGIEVTHINQQDWFDGQNPGFVSVHRRQRPFVMAKIATGLDGGYALADGQSQWISGAASSQYTHQGRACADAIVTTARTVLADNPHLTARLAIDTHQPVPVVLDPQGQLTGREQVFQRGTALWLVGSAYQNQCDWPEQVHFLPTDDQGHFDWDDLGSWLTDHQLDQIWLEAGGVFLTAAWQAGFIDQLILIQAAAFLGQYSKTWAFPPITRMADRLRPSVVMTYPLADEVIWILSR